MKDTEPEIQQLIEAATRAAPRSLSLLNSPKKWLLDERLQEILSNFLVEGPASKELLVGFNAPLGTFSARAAAALSLGLIQENEFKEITLIRKIRNEFGHGWKPMSFESNRVADLCGQLPWLGPAERKVGATVRERFNFAVAILLADLLWRVRLVSKERRALRVWLNRARGA
jgi:hypothetical protein